VAQAKDFTAYSRAITFSNFGSSNSTFPLTMGNTGTPPAGGQGALLINATTTVTINTSTQLGAGTYKLVGKSSAYGVVTNDSLPTPVITGAGAVGAASLLLAGTDDRELFLVIAKGTPTINSNPTAAAITYGQTLANSSFSGGSASVAGAYAFTTPSTAPNVGTSSQSVTFTPTDTANYNTVTFNVNVTVNKATPTISVSPTASAITYGQTLASSNLSGGTASVGGTFAFTTSATKPSAGTANQGITFTPTDTSNYNNATGTASVTVNTKALTISGASATNRAYNRSTTVTVSGGSLVGVEAGDTVTLGGSPTGTVATAAVGTGKAVTVTGYSLGGAQNANYSLTQPTDVTVNITAKGLTITGLTGVNKVYNRSTSATATGTAALSGVETGDTVTISGTPTFTFASSGVATGISISTTGYSLSGADAANYSLTQPTLSANITAKALTISGATATNRAYNRLTTVTVSGGSLVGVEAGDTVTLGGSPAGTVATAAVGTGKAVTVTGYALTGADNANYSVTQPTDVTVNITQAALSITADNESKTFGNTVSSGSGKTAFSSSGLQNSETIGSVTLTYAGGYNATDAAGTYNIVPSAATGGTFTASNYAITYANGTLTVTAIAPTVTTGSAGSGTTSVTISASNVTSDGGTSVTARGIAYGTSASPTISGSATSNGTGTGSFDATLTGLTGGTLYYARAYATNSAGTSYGTQITFTTEADVPAQVTLSRADTAVADGFTVKWTDVANETGYHLNYSTNATFASSVTAVTNIAANATSYAVSGLTPGTTYYVRVRGVSAGGNGTWSNTQSNQIQSIDSGVSRYMSLPGSTASGNYTIADIFGSSNEAGLTSGTTAGNSTVVLLLNASGGTANTIFYNSTAVAWREGGADAGATNVGAGKAFILQNNSGSTDYFLLVGTPRDVLVQPTVSINNSGSKLTLVTTGRTSTTPLADLNLNPGTGDGQFKAATQPKSADRLIVPPADPTQPVTSYWYHSGSSKWYDGLNEVPSAAIPAGQGFFIKKSTDSTFSTWTMPQE
jgi:hypothetical protein